MYKHSVAWAGKTKVFLVTEKGTKKVTKVLHKAVNLGERAVLSSILNSLAVGHYAVGHLKPRKGEALVNGKQKVAVQTA